MGPSLNSTEGFCKERTRGSKRKQDCMKAHPRGGLLCPGPAHLLSCVVTPGEQPLPHLNARGEPVSPGLYLCLDALVVLDDQVCRGHIPEGTEASSPTAHNPQPPPPSHWRSGAPWALPGPLLGIHLHVHPVHPQHQLPDSHEEAELVCGVQQQLAAGSRASLQLGPGLGHSLHVAADLLGLVPGVGLLEPAAIVLYLLNLQGPRSESGSAGDSEELPVLTAKDAGGGAEGWGHSEIFQPEKGTWAGPTGLKFLQEGSARNLCGSRL